MSANIAKIANVTRCMPAELFYIKIDTIGHQCLLRSKNSPYKYRKSNKDFSCQVKTFIAKKRTLLHKNRKNNKSNEIQDLEKEEPKKGFEMSANISRLTKVTRIFLAS